MTANSFNNMSSFAVETWKQFQMITANFPFNQKCVYAPFMALGISSAKTSGISIPFLTGDPRSKSDAQKPANLTEVLWDSSLQGTTSLLNLHVT